MTTIKVLPTKLPQLWQKEFSVKSKNLELFLSQVEEVLGERKEDLVIDIRNFKPNAFVLISTLTTEECDLLEESTCCEI